jgi:putative hydrolase of the HAD superfamily
MIIVFDLDDTLYEEINFVRGGLKAVANHLSENYKIETSEIIYRQFVQLLEEQRRGKVFDSFLDKHNLSNTRVVKKCLAVYRLHDPNIRLSESGLACLERLKDFPKYLVTDGYKIVQTKKVKSLKIDKYFRRMIVTHNYGLKHSKPSTYCFHKILQWENAIPRNLVYIGDNPKKDFVNLKKDGFRTVRVLTGEHKDVEVPVEYEADY